MKIVDHIAEIVLDYPQVKFTDYMSLLKIDGEWKFDGWVKGSGNQGG